MQQENNKTLQGDVGGVKRSDERAIKDNIINCERSMTSLKHIKNKQQVNNEWRLASHYARATPGQGLLPPAPQLELATSSRASAALAAVQLLTPYHLGYSHQQAEVSDSAPTLFAAAQRATSRQAQSLLNSVDNTVNYLIKTLTPWSSVEARPEISIEPDDEIHDPGNLLEHPEIDNELGNSAPAAQNVDRIAYLKVINKIKNEFPLLNKLAADVLRVAIWKKHGMDIDPQKTWFNRFEFSAGSSETFTGWEHNSHPQESKTLVSMLLENFGAEDRINSDALSGNSGIYTQNGEADSFGKHNEVRLLPKDFLKIVVDSNFSEKYLKALAFFWQKNSVNYRTVSKGKFISYMGDKSSNLSEMGVKSVMMAALGNIEKLPAMTMDELNTKISNRPGLSISTFSIYGYHASDIVLIHGYGGKIILYKPSDIESFVEFDNKQALKDWVLEHARDETKLTNLLHHFSVYDRQDGSTYAGVNKALTKMASGSWSEKYIDYQPLNIKGDLFRWFSDQAEKRTLQDSETLTVTNSEVFKNQILMNLEPVIATAGLATIILPGVGSLVMLEAGIIETEMGVYIALYGDTEKERLKGLSAIIDGGVNSLFGALGVAGSLAKQLNVDEKELLGARGEVPRRQAVIHPRPGTFMDNLLNRIIVRGRGIKGISIDNPQNGQALFGALIKMDETLVKARAKLATERGKEIVAAYLGYDEAGKLTRKDIQRISGNIDALFEVLQRINSKEIPIKSVSIYNKKNSGVIAYFNPNKNALSFDDKYFLQNDAEKLQLLIHESVHATSIKGIKGVHMPDYFYVNDHENMNNILTLRNKVISFSAGAVDIRFLRGEAAERVKQNFITKMDSKSEMEAIVKFQYNDRLRKGVLFDNPDTQALMIMELADEISGAVNEDGSLNIPKNILKQQKIKLEELKEVEQSKRYQEKQQAREQQQG
ncbi:hypothetical protein SC206_08730 [Rouxiella sp. T17]|uniref:dermonecrotic toxin domain-containing protein n=1 Tax=Rouxiella sp. T17 TaxID=3085684 RepID=UPI002FC8FE6D